MPVVLPNDVDELRGLMDAGVKHPLATQHFPSRGQTAVQEIYQTNIGRLFHKKTSERNHTDCRIDMATGSLAERECWACRLAEALGLHVPSLRLLDQYSTIQVWLDYPDGQLYATSQRRLILHEANVFDCARFDWLTGQVDRHNANYLYNYVGEEIILIDSAHAFLRWSGSLPHYLEIFEIGNARVLPKTLHTLVSGTLKKLTPEVLLKLVPLRDTQEQQALASRLRDVQHVTTIGDIIALYRNKK